MRHGIPFEIVVVDCRHGGVSSDDFSNHQYYRLSPKVIADVNQVLAVLAPEAIKGRTFSPDGRSWRIDAGPAGKAKKPRLRSGADRER